MHAYRYTQEVSACQLGLLLRCLNCQRAGREDWEEWEGGNGGENPQWRCTVQKSKEKGKDKPKSTLVIVPEARESARSAAWLMVRRSPAYFTGHIYICCRSDPVVAHLSLICPLRVSSKDNDCIDQRRPQWVVLFRQGWERTRGREKRVKESRARAGCPLLLSASSH